MTKSKLIIPVLVAAAALGIAVFTFSRVQEPLARHAVAPPVAEHAEIDAAHEQVGPHAGEADGHSFVPVECLSHGHPAIAAAGNAQDVPQLRTDAGELHAVFDELDGWIEDFAAVDPAAASNDLLAEGVELARERAPLMTQLIVTDPEQALKTAVPASIAKNLPSEIREHMERQVSGMAAFDVRGICEEETGRIERTVTLDGNTYNAFVYGAREDMTTKESVALHGIVLGGAMAVHESPVRVLAPGEEPEAGIETGDLRDFAPDARRVPSEERALDTKPVGSAHLLGTLGAAPGHGEIMGIVGKTLLAFPDAATLAAVNSELSAEQSTIAPQALVLPAAGAKIIKVLYMEAVYAGETASPVPADVRTSALKDVADFWAAASLGKWELEFTVVLVQLPKTLDQYMASGDDAARSAVTRDMHNVAATKGYKTPNYNLWVVAWSSGGGGLGMVGAAGSWTGRWPSVHTLAHELGHNFGCMHGNAWIPNTEDPIGPGTHKEYGNGTCVMGMGTGLNVDYRRALGFLPTVTTVTASGEYRLHACDKPAPAGGAQEIVLQVPVSGQTICLGFHESLGALTMVQRSGSRILASEGWALTQFRAGRHIKLGDVHVDLLRRNETTPPSMDVRVSFGPFPGNRAPTIALRAAKTAVALNETAIFTADATDPDGDPLYYDWRTNEITVAGGGPEFRMSWAGSYYIVVKCVVTDGKGGRASAHLPLKVGSPTSFHLSGKVTHKGAPIEGALVVWFGSTMGATVSSDGSYTLAAFGLNQKVPLAAVKSGMTFVSNFTNPVNVMSHMTNLNFSNVAAIPPVVSLAAGPLAGTAPVSVTFDVTANDPDGTVVSYAWDFGDGSPASADQDPVHQYTRAGFFTARVTVTDNDGASASATAMVNVSEPSGADLAFIEPQIVKALPRKIMVVARMANQGTVDAMGQFNLSVFLSADGELDSEDLLLGEAVHRGNRLPKRAQWRPTILGVAPDADAGEYSVIGVIDGQGQIAEGNEANNTAVLGTVGLLPNLRMERVVAQQAAPGAREVTLVVRLVNDGIGRIPGAVKMAVHASNNGLLSDDDLLVASFHVAPGLKAGETRDVSVVANVPASVPAGRHILILSLDPDEAILETNERDNKRSPGGRVAIK